MVDQPTDIRFLGDLQRLEVKPGDKFVLSVPSRLSLEVHKRIQDQWRQFFGGDHAPTLMILDGGISLSAISASDGA